MFFWSVLKCEKENRFHLKAFLKVKHFHITALKRHQSKDLKLRKIGSKLSVILLNRLLEFFLLYSSATSQQDIFLIPNCLFSSFEKNSFQNGCKYPIILRPLYVVNSENIFQNKLNTNKETSCSFEFSFNDESNSSL